MQQSRLQWPLALVGLLGSDVQTLAAGALFNLAGEGEPAAAAVVAAGDVPALVRLLGHSSTFVQAEAARALGSLAFSLSFEAVAAILAAGAAPTLVQLLGHSSGTCRRKGSLCCAAWQRLINSSQL